MVLSKVPRPFIIHKCISVLPPYFSKWSFSKWCTKVLKLIRIHSDHLDCRLWPIFCCTFMIYSPISLIRTVSPRTSLTLMSVLDPFIQHRQQEHKQSGQHDTRMDTDTSIRVCKKQKTKTSVTTSGKQNKTTNPNIYVAS